MRPSISRRDRFFDIGGIVLALAISGLVVAELPESLSGPRIALVITLSMASAASLWWRRRWPVAIALVIAVPMLVTDAVGGAGLVAVYTVASGRRGGR